MGRRPNCSESSSFKVILIVITLGFVDLCSVVWWLAVQPVSLQGFSLLSRQAKLLCLRSVQTALALLSTITVALALTAALVYFGQEVRSAEARL